MKEIFVTRLLLLQQQF